MHRLLIITLLGTLSISLQAQQPADVSQRKPMVVVISLDAFPARAFLEPRLPAPTLLSLRQHGVYASAMQPINPTITWPNHTALVTGVDASRHLVLANGLIVGQRIGKPEIKPWVPKTELVHAPTVYDLAHNQGLTTAQVNWPAIYHAPTIDWAFPEQPLPDGPIEVEMEQKGIIKPVDLVNFMKAFEPYRDRIYTEAAADIIREHHPNLLLLHLLSLDGSEHRHGFPDEAAYDTIGFLDDRVKDVIEAVRLAGDLDRTTFLIVSDHGQETVLHEIHPRAMLRNMIPEEFPDVDVLSQGGFAYVYLKKATPQRSMEVKQFFADKEGVGDILLPADYGRFGFPTPNDSTIAPDLILFPKEGYQYVPGDTDPAVTSIAPKGAHGYLNCDPSMQAIFIAAGANVDPIGLIPAIPNTDVAATIAKLLHLDASTIPGKPIKLRK